MRTNQQRLDSIYFNFSVILNMEFFVDILGIEFNYDGY